MISNALSDFNRYEWARRGPARSGPNTHLHSIALSLSSHANALSTGTCIRSFVRVPTVSVNLHTFVRVILVYSYAVHCIILRRTRTCWCCVERRKQRARYAEGRGVLSMMANMFGALLSSGTDDRLRLALVRCALSASASVSVRRIGTLYI